MTYNFQPYDVLQIERNGQWLDFCTLRTKGDGIDAKARVDLGKWDGVDYNFRIRRGFNEVVYIRTPQATAGYNVTA